MNRINYLLSVLLMCLALTVSAADLKVPVEMPKRNPVQVSLLTCGPGNAIYTLFGHTAIRVRNVESGQDIVFNYGMFSFNTPNFALRFALGDTDYWLDYGEYLDFLRRYAGNERWVREQVLNITPEETVRLLDLLDENCKPENRIYRYNFFYDNCATRARDVIEDAVDNRVTYSDSLQTVYAGYTYRDIVYECTEANPWSRFGMNFCLGSVADREIGCSELMFAPVYLMEFFRSAEITTGKGEVQPLVSHERWLLRPVDFVNSNTDWLLVFTPQVSFWILFIVVAGLSLYEWKRKSVFWGMDLLLFGAAGICGCLIVFLALFSEHPAVSPNYLLFIFHPLHLFALPFLVYFVRKNRKPVYHLLNLAVLTLFIVLFALIPQRIDLAIVPLAQCLYLRSLLNVVIFYKKKNN